jgi:hypothetical protein
MLLENAFEILPLLMPKTLINLMAKLS